MRITVSCPQCGRIELAKQDLHVVAVPPRRGGQAWYVYDCTGCANHIVVEITPVVVVALATMGVLVWPVPAEFLERDGHCEPPLRVDDVLDAMLWLDDAAAEVPLDRTAP